MKALLLLAFGGPRSLEEVEFLLTRLMKGRRPSPEQLEKVKDRYRLIGGKSPLLEITERQAKALEERLNARGHSFKSYVGMRYSHPLIEETLKEIQQAGLKEVVALPMAPFRSRASTGAYIDEVTRAQKEMGEGIDIFFIEGWHLHPLFIRALQERIREGLSAFTPEERERVHLLFTAHSLPNSMIESDPYLNEIRSSIQEVLDGMEPLPWHFAFQSKGSGPEEWAGPEAETVLHDLSLEKVREVLIVPIGFVSDHIEILYDIDILYQERAKSLGMLLRRTPSLNFSERFMEALTAVIEEGLKKFEGRPQASFDF